MATITITVPDAIAARVNNALSRDYPAVVVGPEGLPIPNPQTKAQYVKQRVIQMIQSEVRRYEASVAAANADKAAESEIALS